MNRVLEPTTVDAKKEEIANEKLLNRQFLFTKDGENLYIKYNDKLIPIGGACKQNVLEAGDNLEMLRDMSGKFHLDGPNGSVYISNTTNHSLTVRYTSDVELANCLLSVASADGNILVERVNMNLVYETTDYEYVSNKKRFEYEITVSHETFVAYNKLLVSVSIRPTNGNYTICIPQGTSGDPISWKGFTYGSETIRLLDDVDIDTLTLSPDDDNTYKWKGMYKIGELYDNNAIFILTKKSGSLQDTDKAIIGGEILVKMYDENDKIQYAHYALTCTSTGSWSLAGAGCTPSNVRMCRCKKKDTGDFYYGLRLPIGKYEDFVIVDTPIWGNDNLSSYVGLWVGDNSNDLWIYNNYESYRQMSKETHIRDYGFVEGDGYSRDLWTVSVADLDAMLGWSSNNSHMLEEDSICAWRDWINNNYKLGITLDTKEDIANAWRVHNISPSIYLSKNGLTGSDRQAYATYTLYRGNRSYQMQDRGTDISIYGGNMSTYNHWYTISMANFFNLMGFNPQGEWVQYNNNNYVFGIRIYTRGYGTRVTAVAILRNVNALTKVKEISANDLDIEFNWDSSLVNLKSIDAYPSNEVYPELGNGDYVDLFKFVDRSPLSQKQGLRVRALDIQIYDENNYPVNDANLDFVRFNQQFLVNNYAFVSNFSNNHLPVFTDTENQIPILFYGNQTDITVDYSTTLLGIQSTAYDYIVEHHLEEQKVLSELILKKAEFWFNGWKHIPDDLTISNYTDADWDYTVLSNKSTDNDSYAETRYFSTVADYRDTINGLPAMQDTGEDNAPYKIIITQEWLSMQDLLNITEHVKHLEKQVALDLSNCKVRTDAEIWNTAIFEGCVSLREISVPQGIREFGQGIFKWCTYLRKVDLTPSENTLHTIGGTAWEQNAGFLVSTRVTTLVIPKNVSLLRNYLVYASNLKTLIFLHDATIGFKEDQANVSAANRVGTLSAAEWAWVGQTGNQQLVYDLPDGFHLFFSKDFWENGRSKGNNAGQPNRNGSGWDWYPNNANAARWNKRVIDSIAIFPQDGTQEEWQAFEDQYHWGEDLINEIRAKYGHDMPIEIKSEQID